MLLASGMIVGEGLIGVLIAGDRRVLRQGLPASLVGDEFAANGALWIGGIAFVVVIFALYRWIENVSRKTAA